MIIWVSDDQTMPSLRDFGDVGVLCTFRNEAAAGDCQKIAAEQSLASAGGKVRHSNLLPAHHSTNHRPLYPSPPARQGRTPCWLGSLRTSASVV